MADEIKISVAVETDSGSINKAKSAIREIETTAKKTDKPFRGIGDAARESAKEVKIAAEKMEEALKGVGDVADSLDAQLRSADEAFSKTSQNVALAGDTESSLRTVGGAIGSFGGTGVEQAIGGASELLAVVEALPKLKEAASALPATMNAAGASFGVSGLAFGAALGVAAVAIGAAVFAINMYNDSVKDQVAAIEASTKARRAADEFAVSGATTADAKKRLEELEQLQKYSHERQLRAEEEYQDSKYNLLQKWFGDDEEAALERIQAEKDLRIEQEQELIALSDALEANKFATGDARVAEEELTKQREKSAQEAQREQERLAQQASAAAIAEASAIGEVLQARQESVKLNKEELRTRVQNNQNAIAVAQAQIASLRSSGVQTEQTTAAIDSLTRKIDTLKKTTEVYENAVGRASEVQKAAAKEVFGVNAEYIQNLKNFHHERRRMAEEELKAQEKAQKDLAKMNNDFHKKEAAAVRDAFRSELQATIDQQRNLLKIKENATRAEADAIRSGDIFAIRDIREQLQENIRDSQRDFEYGKQDRATKSENARMDRLVDFRERFAESGLGGVTFNITNADPMQTAMIVQQQIQRLRY
jgi:hypothetical protein